MHNEEQGWGRKEKEGGGKVRGRQREASLPPSSPPAGPPVAAKAEQGYGGVLAGVMGSCPKQAMQGESHESCDIK